MRASNLLSPDWEAPETVSACSTLRFGGCSLAPYDSFNLGAHVGDQPEHVTTNRQRLREALSLPADPFWLNQVHGASVVRAGEKPSGCDADASIARTAGEVCVIMTADCLPVLFCSRQGDEVAAAHAGWRGLSKGVLESTLSGMQTANSDILAWLGPAIGPTAFEVGDEVRAVFVAQDAANKAAFVSNRPGHWLADLYQLARIRLRNAGVTRISGGGFCTYTDRARFFSYRRDGVTGRMASLIWISKK